MKKQDVQIIKKKSRKKEQERTNRRPEIKMVATDTIIISNVNSLNTKEIVRMDFFKNTIQ